MLKYVIVNITQAVSILIGVITVTFVLMYIMPGDPAGMMLGQRSDEESIRTIREELGLNKPLYAQYAIFMSKALRGDFGTSYITNRNVSKTIIVLGWENKFILASKSSPYSTPQGFTLFKKCVLNEIRILRQAQDYSS